MIRFSHLRLQNFRCFEDCEISFHPDLTVLVARNGQGKTALLDAIAVAFGLFVDTVSGIPQERRIEWRDVRRIREGELGMASAGTVEFHAAGIVDGDDIMWGRKRRGDSPKGQTSRKDAKPLTAIANRLRRRITEQVDAPTEPMDLPLVAYYGTGRRWQVGDGKAVQPTLTVVNERCLGYADCLSGTASYSLFVDWYRRTFESLSEKKDTLKGKLIPNPITGYVKANRPELLLAVVNQAVKSVLAAETGWQGLHWDKKDGLVLEHPAHGLLPMDFLSDGVRNTAALVADVAHRCVRLNPHLEDAVKETAGILIIDEVDLHLHPEWQQRIVEMLRSTFPKVQLILSTHSPQVLSTIYSDQIRVIRFREGLLDIQEPRFQTRGVESADVLAAIMGVDPVPKVAEASWLSDYRAAIELGTHDESAGLELRSRLQEHFGGQHPLMLECDRLIRFSRFKQRRAAEGGNDAPA